MDVVAVEVHVERGWGVPVDAFCVGAVKLCGVFGLGLGGVAAGFGEIAGNGCDGQDVRDQGPVALQQELVVAEAGGFDEGAVRIEGFDDGGVAGRDAGNGGLPGAHDGMRATATRGKKARDRDEARCDEADP